MFRTVILALFVSLALTACQTDQWGTDQTVGTIGGAAAGGLVGGQFGRGNGQLATTGLGVVLGAWAGNEIGASMDEDDRARNRQAERRAEEAPVGKQITWNNPASGHSGTITPVHDSYVKSGAYCRDFQQSVLIEGQQKQGFCTACQQPDGSWKIAP